MLGMTLAQAKAALNAADAGPYSWLYGCYGSPGIGLVVRQTPTGGSEVPRTTLIQIFLQANNCAITVPDMLGMTLAQAKAALNAADAGQYSWLYGCYGSPDIGQVIRQTPAGGTEVPRTTLIQIFLQNNNCAITVPDMLGMTLAQAKAALNAADAGQYSWLYGCYGSPNIGLVVRQTPAGGTEIPRTTLIQIFLQNNNCPATTP
jgi:beta-lactam-binding protein with PASTA domain